MYRHPGKTLKTIGTIVFVLNLIIAVLASVPLFSLAKWQGIFVLYGFLAIGVGVLIGYLCGLCFAAFGELVENSKKCEFYLSEIHKNTGGTSTYSTEDSSVLFLSDSSSESVSPQKARIVFLTGCSKCGAINDRNAIVCKECGASVSADLFKVCPECDTLNDYDARVCTECGHSI